MCLWNRFRGLLKRKKSGEQAIIDRDDSVTIRITKDCFICKIVTASAQHIGTRQYQQDALYVSKAISFVYGTGGTAIGVLCDGMGGLTDGGETSRQVVDIFSKALLSLKNSDDIPGFFEQQIKQTDQVIYRGATQGLSGSTGTTLVAAIIIGNKLYWCSVGDSRIYILRKGEIACATRDHNYLLQLKEMVKHGEITYEAAYAHPKKEALISYIGCGKVEIIDTNSSPFFLEHGDVVLLCSDGLNKSLEDNEIKKIVYANIGNLVEAARLLPLMAYDKNNFSKDNTSVVLMQYLE